MSTGAQNIEMNVIALVFPALGLIVTAGRLALRIRSGRFWWDDALAIGSCTFTALMATVKWIYYTPTYGKGTRITAYYTMAVSFYIALWTARLSILYSILRIVPLRATRRILNGASIAFACVCAILCAQVFWVCETQPGWKDKKPTPQCALGLQVAVCELLADVTSDLLLIIVPVRLFGSVDLEWGLKIRLLIIFGAAAFITTTSLVHAVYLLEGRGVPAILSSIVEISVSLTVCNLIVVLPAFWRVCGVCDESRERSFMISLPTVRFADRPDRTHVSVIDASNVLSAQDPGVLDVITILHDPASCPVAEPLGRKSTLSERDEALKQEPPLKRPREREEDPE